MSLLDNLVSYWKLDEASGTRADSHGSNDLTDNNTVGSTTGKLNNAASFVAANSEYLSATGSDLTAGTGSMTLAGWLRVNSLAANRPIASKGASRDGSPATAAGYNCQILPSGAVMSVFGDTANSTRLVSSSGAGEIVVGNTYHWAYVIDRAAHQVRVYKNNSLILTQDISSRAGDCSSSSNFHLGANAAAVFWFDGWLDEWGCWNRVLIPTEIGQLYNSGNGLAYENFAPPSTHTRQPIWFM